VDRGAHGPRAAGLRQFLVEACALGEEGEAAWGEESGRYREEAREWGEGAGGDDWCRGERGGFDSCVVDGGRGLGDAGGLAEEGGFSDVGLHEVERDSGGDGEDQARQAAAGAEVDGVGGGGWDEGDEGDCVVDVSGAEIREVGGGDEVDFGVPETMGSGASLIPGLRCFT
jgi:hypothetical protein